MKYTEYSDGKDLLTMEALYQILARMALDRGMFLSRDAFLRSTYKIVTTCDGLLAIVKRGLQLNIVVERPAGPHGFPALR